MTGSRNNGPGWHHIKHPRKWKLLTTILWHNCPGPRRPDLAIHNMDRCVAAAAVLAVAAVVKWAAATFNGSLLISSRKLYREWEVERSTSGSCVINLKSGQTADCAQWVTPLQVELQWRPPQWNSPSEIYFAASFQWRLEQRIYYIYYLLAVLQFLFVNHSFKYLAQFRT